MKALLVLLAATTLAMVGCKKKKDPAPPPPQPKARVAPIKAPAPVAPVKVSKNVAVVQAGYRAFNEGRLAEAVRDMAPRVAWVNIGTGKRGRLAGKKAVRAFFAATRKTFPNARITPIRIFDAGDTVVVESIYTGTQRGSWMGRAAKGLGFGLGVAHWFDLEKGRVVRVHAFLDVATMMQQLGLSSPGGMPVVKAAPAPSGHPKVYTGAATGRGVAQYRGLVKHKSSSSGLAKFLAPDLRLRVGGAGVEIKGIKAFRRASAPLEKAFPDLNRKVLEIRGVGAWVLVRMRLEGTQTGKLGRIPPTGKKVRLHPVHVVHFTKGKLDWGTAYSNRLELPAQLGLLDRGKKKRK